MATENDGKIVDAIRCFTLDKGIPVLSRDAAIDLIAAYREQLRAYIESRHQAEIAAAYLAAECAWLAERLDSGEPQYGTVDDIGIISFTKDSNKALRFKRMEDARQFAGLFDLEDVRAREHSWPDVSTPSTDDAKKALALREAKARLEEHGERCDCHYDSQAGNIFVPCEHRVELESAVRELGGTT